MLRKKTQGIAKGSRSSSVLSNVASHKVDRRGFLRGSGLAIGGLAASDPGLSQIGCVSFVSADGVRRISEAGLDLGDLIPAGGQGIDAIAVELGPCTAGQHVEGLVV